MSSSDIGTKLKQLRLNHHLTQLDLARELHVSRQTVSSWETNRNHPDVDTIQAIANFYQMSMTSLISKNEPSPVNSIIKFSAWSCILFCLVLERLTQVSTNEGLYWFDMLIVWIVIFLIIKGSIRRRLNWHTTLFNQIHLILFGTVVLIGGTNNLFNMGFGLMVTSVVVGLFSIINGIVLYFR